MRIRKVLLPFLQEKLGDEQENILIDRLELAKESLRNEVRKAAEVVTISTRYTRVGSSKYKSAFKDEDEVDDKDTNAADANESRLLGLLRIEKPKNEIEKNEEDEKESDQESGES